MASVGATPKVRSRAGGSAIPLDDLDRRLLNLMQGRFPLCLVRPPRWRARPELPRRRSSTRLRLVAGASSARSRPSTTRARSATRRCSSRPRSIPRTRIARPVVNSHPGVSHNYLRDHDFNLWFTLAVEPDSTLGMDGTLEVLQRLTGAESIRQLPTLQLFKIRMDLEMESGTEALAAAVEAAPPAETEPQPYDELDIAVIRATQGHQPVVAEPYAEPARALGMPVDDLLAHMSGMIERRLLRRVAAILFHRRAGFSANGMGVWNVPEDRIMELAPRMAAVRGISHCSSAPRTPTGPTPSSRWRTGAARTSATPSSTRSPR